MVYTGARWSELEDIKLVEYTELGYTQEKIAYLMAKIFMRPFTRCSINTRMRDLKVKKIIEANKKSGPVLAPSGARRTGKECKKMIPKKLKKKKYHGPEHGRYIYGVQTEVGSD